MVFLSINSILGGGFEQPSPQRCHAAS